MKIIEARGITKRYPGVTALEGVDFSMGPGEVVGLIGENGAGKSTLIKVLGGLTQPDAGEIRVAGEAVRIPDAAEATRRGIGVIHQELNNLDNLDVAGNVFLGHEPRRWGLLIDRREMTARTEVFLRRLGLDLSPHTPLHRLSIAQQQMVEIAKALALEARVLIMDEPTSSLAAAETERLLRVVRELREEGVGVVYVSHRLGEVKAVADRVVVLRDGRRAGELTREEIDHGAMVRLMVGRDLEKCARADARARGARLSVRRLRTHRYPAHEVSFDVREGEIVGLAGLIGAGRTEVARAAYGIDSRVEGVVTLDGEEVPPNSPREAIARGLYLAPEDRRKEGLVTSMCVRENVTLPALPRYAARGIVSRRREAVAADTMRERLRIKAPTVETTVRGLSGGNQQKVVLAKWLSMEPKCLIFDEPTRGIDIGARSELYDLMRALAGQGAAILMISSDMEEVLAMSDRVLVMHEGRLAGELACDEASEEAIMRLAVGRA